MKRLAIAFVGITCVVIGFSLIMVSVTTTNTTSNDSNHSSSINYSVNPGQSLVLDSNEAFQQKPEAYLPWDGTLVVTLIDCDVYENMQEAGIDSSSPFYRDDGPAPNSKWKYVQCSLEIENVDAVPEGDDGLSKACYRQGCAQLRAEPLTAGYPAGIPSHRAAGHCQPRGGG